MESIFIALHQDRKYNRDLQARQVTSKEKCMLDVMLRVLGNPHPLWPPAEVDTISIRVDTEKTLVPVRLDVCTL